MNTIIKDLLLCAISMAALMQKVRFLSLNFFRDWCRNERAGPSQGTCAAYDQWAALL